MLAFCTHYRHNSDFSYKPDDDKTHDRHEDDIHDSSDSEMPGGELQYRCCRLMAHGRRPTSMLQRCSPQGIRPTYLSDVGTTIELH